MITETKSFCCPDKLSIDGIDCEGNNYRKELILKNCCEDMAMTSILFLQSLCLDLSFFQRKLSTIIMQSSLKYFLVSS